MPPAPPAVPDEPAALNEPAAPDKPAAPRRIAIVIHALTGGGSEHVAARMANGWARSGRDVTLITLDSISGDSIPVDPRVRRIGLGLLSESHGLLDAARANFRRIRALRRALRDAAPDAVLSLTDRTNVLTLLATRGTGLRTVVAERIDVRRHRIGRAWEWLRRRTYPRAAAIVVQTEPVRQAVRLLAGRAPVVVIPNCVWPPEPASVRSPESVGPPGLESRTVGNIESSPLPATDRLIPGRRYIVSVGRLVPQKGFDRLIDAFAQLAADCPDCDLILIGDGPDRGALRRRARDAGLENRVRMPGWIERPWPVLPDDAVFVLASRYEGFPNALLEAMARGLACVSFDCPTGPAEIIRPGEDGLLIPDGDVTRLADALRCVLTDDPLRTRLAQAARRVSDRFTVDDYFRRWDAVLSGRPLDG